MGVELHKDLLGSIGVDVERHAKMMGMGLEAYKAGFMSQPNRPKGMAYFDWFMSEIQAQRIAEINALRAQKNQRWAHFVSLSLKRSSSVQEVRVMAYVEAQTQL